MTRYTAEKFPRTLHFSFPAGTSRGVYTTRDIHLVHVVRDDGREGWGEAAPLPGLSPELSQKRAWEEILSDVLKTFEETGEIPENAPSSARFALETALRQIETGADALFDTPFSRGEEGIAINGLIWMGDYELMARRLEAKLAAGFHCIKVKIGAIDFDHEMALLERIRRDFPAEKLTLRVDANGAFGEADVMEKLSRIARYDVHSIEQPVKAGQWELMARIAKDSPVPVALDEELIGWSTFEERERLVDAIRPAHLVLKPSLHGGMKGCEQWIELARSRGMGWWITSALESNLGLNAVAQFCAHMGPDPRLTQGLGTGGLFTNNLPGPLKLRGERLWFDPKGTKLAPAC